MNKFFFLLGLFFAFNPFSVSAFTYSRTPVGENPSNPIILNLTFENFSEFDLGEGINSFGFVFNEDNVPRGNCYSIANNNISENFNFIEDYEVYFVGLMAFSDENCTGENYVGYYPLGDSFVTSSGNSSWFPVSGSLSATNGKNLMLNAGIDLGKSLLIIFGSIIGILVGYLIFKYGWWKLFHDQSLEIGGYYLRKTPYAGYKRFRSKKWNMEHMP